DDLRQGIQFSGMDNRYAYIRIYFGLSFQ
ncbi:unnamed protein product, partial [Rotaria magnacalcarata]